MKICYTGKESSGKSLKLAKVVRSLVIRNYKWYKKSGIIRPIASNLKFSTNFENWAKGMNIPLKYWSNLDELINFEQCDIIIDEIPNYFDSRGWADLNLDVRRWLTQGAKCGIEMYCSAQDFAQVDIAFRRLTNQLYRITKIIGSRRPSSTKPPVKTIWGLCSIRAYDPMNFDETKQKFKPLSYFPSFFTIDKADCDIFDTSQKIVKSKPLEFKHIFRHCPDCDFVKVAHI